MTTVGRDVRKGIRLCVSISVLLAGGTASGQTWNTQVSGTAQQLTRVAFLSTTRVVAAGKKNGPNYTIVVSTDGGVTWNPAGVGGGAPAADDLKAMAFQGNIGLLVGKGGLILRSVDSGDNWDAPATNPAPDDLKALAFNGATAVAVGKRSGGVFNLVRSTDSGDNWAVPAGVPAGNQDLEAVTFVSPTTLVAVGKSGTILRSADSGANWVDESGVTAQDLRAVAASGTHVVAVGKDNGAGMTVLYSADSGANWAPATIIGDAALTLDALLFLTGGTAVAVGKSNGAAFTVIRTIDGGVNWSVPAGLAGGVEDLKALAGVNSFVIAVGKAGTILASEDLGATWAAQVSGTANDLLAAAAINPVMAVGAGGTVLLSNDQATGAASSGGTSGGTSGFFASSVPPEEAATSVPVGGEWLVLVLLFGLGVRRVR